MTGTQAGVVDLNEEQTIYYLNVKVKVFGAFFFHLRKGSHDHRSLGDRLLYEMAEFNFNLCRNL